MLKIYTWPKNTDLHAISAFAALKNQPGLKALYRFGIITLHAEKPLDTQNVIQLLTDYDCLINPNNTAFSLTEPEFLEHPSYDSYCLNITDKTPVSYADRVAIINQLGVIHITDMQHNHAWGIHMQAGIHESDVVDTIVEPLLVNTIGETYTLTRGR
jgi:hypothetical protein